MRMSLNRTPGGPARPRRQAFRRLGLGALVFFTLKGVAWLAIGGFALTGVL